MILRFWPLPAVLTWATAWAWYGFLRWMSVPVIWALLVATLWGVLSSAVGSTLQRAASMGRRSKFCKMGSFGSSQLFSTCSRYS